MTQKDPLVTRPNNCGLIGKSDWIYSNRHTSREVNLSDASSWLDGLFSAKRLQSQGKLRPSDVASRGLRNE